MLKKYIPSSVFCAGLLFLSGSAVADTQRSAMISCPKIPEAEARLKCFDLAAEKYAREMNGMQRKETEANAPQKNAATFGQGYLKTSPDPKSYYTWATRGQRTRAIDRRAVPSDCECSDAAWHHVYVGHKPP